MEDWTRADVEATFWYPASQALVLAVGVELGLSLWWPQYDPSQNDPLGSLSSSGRMCLSPSVSWPPIPSVA